MKINKIKNIKILLFIAAFACASLLTPSQSVNSAASVPYKWSNVKIGGGGGFVTGIIYNPTEEGLVYARTDMGGFFFFKQKTAYEMEL